MRLVHIWIFKQCEQGLLCRLRGREFSARRRKLSVCARSALRVQAVFPFAPARRGCARAAASAGEISTGTMRTRGIAFFSSVINGGIEISLNGRTHTAHFCKWNVSLAPAEIGSRRARRVRQEEGCRRCAESPARQYRLRQPTPRRVETFFWNTASGFLTICSPKKIPVGRNGASQKCAWRAP